METIIKPGTLVRIRKEWCDRPEEHEYLHIVLENRLNPVTNKMTRYLIETINMKHMTIAPTEVVEDNMIELA